MCLGAPAEVIAVNDLVGTVEVHGETREVALVLLDEPVSKGDHVIVHLGFAVRRIAPEDVDETMAAFRALTAEVEGALNQRARSSNDSGRGPQGRNGRKDQRF